MKPYIGCWSNKHVYKHCLHASLWHLCHAIMLMSFLKGSRECENRFNIQKTKHSGLNMLNQAQSDSAWLSHHVQALSLCLINRMTLSPRTAIPHPYTSMLTVSGGRNHTNVRMTWLYETQHVNHSGMLGLLEKEERVIMIRNMSDLSTCVLVRIISCESCPTTWCHADYIITTCVEGRKGDYIISVCPVGRRGRKQLLLMLLLPPESHMRGIISSP